MDVTERDVPTADWVDECAALVSQGATMLDFLTAVDDPGAGRITLVVHLVDVAGRRRHLIRTSVDRGSPEVATLTGVCPGAAWHEREVHELFGVGFAGNDDLRPLLTDGKAGFPLRRSTRLPRRAATPWPGVVDPADRPPADRPPVAVAGPGRSGHSAARPRTRAAAPGVHPEWQP